MYISQTLPYIHIGYLILVPNSLSVTGNDHLKGVWYQKASFPQPIP